MPKNFENLISGAFFWIGTDEGWDYWNDLDTKWLEFIKK